MMDAVGNDLPTPAGIYARRRVYDALLAQNFICFSSVVVRRDVFEAVGLFDPDLPLAIDYDLWLRVAPHYEFDYVDEAQVRYRTGHANLSNRVAERVAAVLSILRRSLVRHRNSESANHKSQARAWASTCRTMGYVLRKREPRAATTWYARAARHDGHWLASLKSVLGGFVRRSST